MIPQISGAKSDLIEPWYVFILCERTFLIILLFGRVLCSITRKSNSRLIVQRY